VKKAVEERRTIRARNLPNCDEQKDHLRPVAHHFRTAYPVRCAISIHH
jgi:hypothetical protein